MRDGAAGPSRYVIARRVAAISYSGDSQLYPKRYGVIDIRVWQVLHKMGTVTQKAKGVGFNFANWYQFLMIIRYFSRVLDVKARDVEWALFLAHKDHQKGGLY